MKKKTKKIWFRVLFFGIIIFGVVTFLNILKDVEEGGIIENKKEISE